MAINSKKHANRVKEIFYIKLCTQRVPRIHVYKSCNYLTIENILGNTGPICLSGLRHFLQSEIPGVLGGGNIREYGASCGPVWRAEGNRFHHLPQHDSLHISQATYSISFVFNDKLLRDLLLLIRGLFLTMIRHYVNYKDGSDIAIYIFM
jgi:hypothetical protein